jgi:hypothetical protein
MTTRKGKRKSHIFLTSHFTAILLSTFDLSCIRFEMIAKTKSRNITHVNIYISSCFNQKYVNIPQNKSQKETFSIINKL